MGLTPVEILLYGLLGVSLVLLALMVLWHFSSTARRQVEQWRDARRRRPDELLQLRTENSRLKAEHVMMARRLERTLDDARAFAARKEAEASRAINRAGFLEEELAAAREKIARHEQSIVALGKQLTELRQEITDTNDRAERVYQWRSELEVRLQERKRELEKLQHELYLRADALATTERKLERAQLRLKEYEDRHREGLRTQQQLAKQVDALRRDLQERNDIIRQLEARLNEEHSRFMRDKMQLQERITELSVKLAAKEAELAAALATASGDDTTDAADKEKLSA